MPQSFCQIYVHLIFSTKYRMRHLDDTIRNRVHGYLANTIREMGSAFTVIGGTDDHVHALFDLGKQQTPPDFPLQIKKESSKFIKELGTPYDGFAWQRGYGMFSVGPTNTEAVEAYIRNQHEHHRNMSFQEEFRAFLDRYGIDYDEQYVWD